MPYTVKGTIPVLTEHSLEEKGSIHIEANELSHVGVILERVIKKYWHICNMNWHLYSMKIHFKGSGK